MSPKASILEKYNAFKLSNFEICASVLALILLLQLTGFIVQKFYFVDVNDGLFFGLYGNNFISIMLSVTLLAVLYFFREKFGFLIIFIAGGAISNIVDRLIYGGSIDYIAIGNFPVFNLADIFITTGCFVSVLFIASGPYKKSPRQ